MEKLLSVATRLFLLFMVITVVVLLFAVPVIGPWLFSDSLPEKFRFENLPLWIQIPVGCFVGLYCILELWAFWKHGLGTKANDPKALPTKDRQ